jgi:hypothetical protein
MPLFQEVNMTHIIDTRSKRRLSAMVTTGIVLSAIFAFGAVAVSASADNGDRGRGRGHGYYNNWNGGYYRAPPVVYGSPYGPSYYGTPYYAPPVVYGPAPGFSINIR